MMNLIYIIRIVTKYVENVPQHEDQPLFPELISVCFAVLGGFPYVTMCMKTIRLAVSYSVHVHLELFQKTCSARSRLNEMQIMLANNGMVLNIENSRASNAYVDWRHANNYGSWRRIKMENASGRQISLADTY